MNKRLTRRHLALEESPGSHGGIEVTTRILAHEEDRRPQRTANGKRITHERNDRKEQEGSNVFSCSVSPHLMF